MSEEEKKLLLEMMNFFTFELHRGIKEYGGASNFKTEEACDVIFKILYQYDVNIIDIKTHKDLEKEIERLREENLLLRASEPMSKLQEDYGYKAEVERLNNIINKKEQFLGDNIKRLEREVVKRDNIINELEKFLIQLNTKIKEITNVPFDVKEIMEQLDKLQELKGSDKE